MLVEFWKQPTSRINALLVTKIRLTNQISLILFHFKPVYSVENGIRFTRNLDSSIGGTTRWWNFERLPQNDFCYIARPHLFLRGRRPREVFRILPRCATTRHFFFYQKYHFYLKAAKTSNKEKKDELMYRKLLISEMILIGCGIKTLLWRALRGLHNRG